MEEPTQEPSFIKRSVTADGICVLTFDDPNSSANVLRASVLNELAGQLTWIEKQNHHELRALVIESAKDRIFIAGADVAAFQELSPVELQGLLELGQQVFNRLADISVPTVAAIHGACLGGGLELALACDYRVASDDKDTKLALPETMLGIIPAWGGCTRLPRLIGVPKALNLILSGKKLAAKQAKKLGLIDAVSPREYLTKTARTLLPNGKARRKHHTLTNNRLTGALLRAWIRRQVRKRTRGNYPAPLKALEVVTLGAWQHRADSLALERDAVLELAAHSASPNLIRTFLLQQRSKKLTYTTPKTTVERGVPAEPIVKTAVIGAGVMGAGIAHWLSSRKLKVILQDISPEQIASGLTLIAKRYGEAVKRRIFTPAEAQRLQEHIYPASDPVPLQSADLVIEAATENLELKKKIFQDLEARSGEDTILATNTSALPIGDIAAALKRPERVIGIHFFNPVHRMQLVEIVVAKQTAPETVVATLAFVKGIGKLPVIVSDSPGFLVNRVLVPYLVEAGNLYTRGIPAHAIDSTMLDFGMPMGPLRLLDEIGLDVALDVAETLAAAFPGRMSVPGILEKMVADGQLGKKTGRGFYVYEKGRERRPCRAADAAPASSASISGLQSRMSLVMINEAARCLDEGVVKEPEDVDFAMIMGTGFAPFRGGPLRHADSLGAATIVNTLNDFAASDGDHFAPCDRLVKMGKSGLTFYAKEK